MKNNNGRKKIHPGRPRISPNHIMDLRLKKKIPFNEALELLGIKKSMLYQIESGKKNPSVKTAQKMCKVYGCELEDIFTESGGEQNVS